jgi:hypothetical protein
MNISRHIMKPSSTSTPSFDRDEPQFFNVFDLPWRVFDHHEAVAGLDARLISNNERTGASTYLVRIDPGWGRTLTTESEAFECFVLEGDLAAHEHRVRSGGFLAVPQHSGPVKLHSSGGATAYVFSTPGLLPPAYESGLHSSTLWQEEWIPASLTGVRHGIASKSLRVPDIRGAARSGGPSGFLRITTMTSGFAEPRSEWHHSCWEEIIILSGDMIMGDRGLMAPGTLLANPADYVHYPAASQRGCLLLIQTDAPQDVEFSMCPGGFELLEEYMETLSWCSAPIHATWDPRDPPLAVHEGDVFAGR